MNESEVKKKNRHGRASRRRKAKLRSIQEAEDSFWREGDNWRLEPIKGTPADRSRTWPAVIQRRSERWSNEDEASIIGQIGYLPGNAVAMAARSDQFPSLCINGSVPVVLELYPIVLRDAYDGGKSDGRKFKSRKRTLPDDQERDPKSETSTDVIEPFPTMFWLTHPLLRILVSKLEMGISHNVKIFESKIATNKEWLDSMKEAHEAYGKARWNLLSESDREFINHKNWSNALNTGVAGIRKPDAVKCLHAHLAHYLSGGPGSKKNLVGKWVMDEVCNLVKTRQEAQAG
mmetsp:Transcript_32203/g.47572  ORF Transcript_32203/g.47572 Transcript_32203/m.47572 type:complete len:289 (-) Transcript_32203:1099-1965(-)